MHLLQQLPFFFLQTQIFVPQTVDGGAGVGAAAQSGGNDAAGGGAQAGIHFLQPGFGAEDGLPPGAEVLLPGRLVRFKLLLGKAHQLSIV